MVPTSSTDPTSPSNPSKPPRLQLRIDFDSAPSRPTVLEVELVGTRIFVDVTAGLIEDAWGYLISAGIQARVETDSPILFDAAQLNKLTELPSQVSISPVGAVRTLYELVVHPPPIEFPVTLYVNGPTVMLRWFDGINDHNVALHPKAIPAFLTLQVPFIADAAAWDVLMSSSELRPIVGKVRLNYEGFCEIAALTPQLVESAPIPALFRIDDTHFGFPAVFAAQVHELKGFQWEGRIPSVSVTPPPLPKLPVPLRPHLREEIPLLAQALSTHGGHVLAWDRGLGRRIAALGAIETLDAYPALIVTTPWRVWLWQRQLDALGRSCATTHTRNDVQITTYHDLTLRKDHINPVSIILDDIGHPQALSNTSKDVLRALIRTYPDMLRIGVLSATLPSDEIAQSILDLVRPGEFRSTLPLPRRYPGDFQLQFQRHMSCYISTSTLSSISTRITDSRNPATRATVEVAQPSTAQREAILDLRRLSHLDPIHRLSEALEIISAGTSHDVSPKLVRAIAFAQQELTHGHKVAVIVSHSRTITLLKASLAAHEVHVAQGASGERVAALVGNKTTPLVLIVDQRSTQPDLSTFDAVLVLDYPWNMESIDHMIGTPSATVGPKVLRILHLTDTPDDRVALFAAMRSETATPATAYDPPDTGEALYLLAPRHAHEMQETAATTYLSTDDTSHLLF